MPLGDRNLGEAIAAEGFGGLSVGKITDVAKQIAEALHHLHEHGIIHGYMSSACCIRHLATKSRIVCVVVCNED